MVSSGSGTSDASLSYNAALVLQAIARGHRYGFDIMRATSLGSGTVYPLLRRLQRGSLVTSRWEGERQAHQDGRPRRRYYEATPAAQRVLTQALERIAAQRQLFGGRKADGTATA